MSYKTNATDIYQTNSNSCGSCYESEKVLPIGSCRRTCITDGECTCGKN